MPVWDRASLHYFFGFEIPVHSTCVMHSWSPVNNGKNGAFRKAIRVGKSNLNNLIMNITEAYVKVLQNFAVFNGRARRSEYWYFVLMNVLVSIGLGFVGGFLGFGETLSNIYYLAVLVPSLAAAVRRMHDVGKSGWFILIPIYNLILAVSDSQPGANEYGENPKGVSA